MQQSPFEVLFLFLSDFRSPEEFAGKRRFHSSSSLCFFFSFFHKIYSSPLILPWGQINPKKMTKVARWTKEYTSTRSEENLVVFGCPKWGSSLNFIFLQQQRSEFFSKRKNISFGVKMYVLIQSEFPLSLNIHRVVGWFTAELAQVFTQFKFCSNRGFNTIQVCWVSFSFAWTIKIWVCGVYLQHIHSQSESIHCKHIQGWTLQV